MMLTDCYRFFSKEINVQWMFSSAQALEIGEREKREIFFFEGRGEDVGRNHSYIDR